MQNIIVDLIPGYTSPAVCNVSQNDKNRPIEITLKEQGRRYELTGAEVLIIASHEMTAAQGVNFCEIKIKDNKKDIGAANFKMEVEQGI